MKYKIERLQTIPGKRIIVVGGSSVPFALKSELIEQYLPDYQVVNFGMYANMGTVIMLDWAKAEVHEGDIFVLAPEQNQQALSCFFSGEDIWQASDGAFHQISLLSPQRYETLAAAFPSFAGKKLHYTIADAPSPNGIYAKSSFNDYGDISYSDRKNNIMTGGYNPNDLISFEKTVIDNNFIDEMNNFAREVTAQGAKVFYHFSPINAEALSPGTTPTDIDEYYNFLNQKLLFPILGNPHHCILESGWFYDSNFHLNASGATVYTKTFIEDLKLYLEDSSPTDIHFPAMPEMDYSLLEGDNSCIDSFTYQQQDNGWILNSLTESGRKLTEVILPCSYQGKPIIGMSESLFVGNTCIKKITIQPNIKILYDGMFQGCTQLQQLILTSDNPSDYAIGDQLMNGADFFICVPETAIDSYRRNYFWQKYASFFISTK